MRDYPSFNPPPFSFFLTKKKIPSLEAPCFIFRELCCPLHAGSLCRSAPSFLQLLVFKEHTNPVTDVFNSTNRIPKMTNPHQAGSEPKIRCTPDFPSQCEGRKLKSKYLKNCMEWGKYLSKLEILFLHVSKLVFYAQSTSSVISGRYTSLSYH